jgi:hypothetical protein
MYCVFVNRIATAKTTNQQQQKTKENNNTEHWTTLFIHKIAIHVRSSALLVNDDSVKKEKDKIK